MPILNGKHKGGTITWWQEWTRKAKSFGNVAKAYPEEISPLVASLQRDGETAMLPLSLLEAFKEGDGFPKQDRLRGHVHLCLFITAAHQLSPHHFPHDCCPHLVRAGSH